MSDPVTETALAPRECTCQAYGEWRESRVRHGDLAGSQPDECRIHPVQTIMGDIKISTICRQCSAVEYNGWYEETMVFQIRDGKWEVVDQGEHHFDMVTKWLGGDVAVYESGWRAVEGQHREHGRSGNVHTDAVSKALAEDQKAMADDD